jgi:hypothetical protein
MPTKAGFQSTMVQVAIPLLDAPPSDSCFQSVAASQFTIWSSFRIEDLQKLSFNIYGTKNGPW